MRSVLAIPLLAMVLPVSAQVTFVDVTATAGQGLGDGSTRGISWVDFNNDGLQDLFVPTAGNTPNKLYMNNGNGTFTDVAALVGLSDLANTITCTWADFDNDGDLDLVAGVSGGPLRLWRNNRQSGNDTTFTSIETIAGITTTGGQMPAWADFDNDGLLDFYVPVSSSAAQPDALYRNNGDGTFTNVSIAAGVNHQSSSILEQAVHWCDFDMDGYPDLFIGNLQTGGPSFFHRNNGNGTFTEIAATLGFNLVGRGAQWVDYNNDGLWDFSFAGGNAATRTRLFRNNGDGTFTNVDSAAGLLEALVSWGVTWADYDNDGFEDLFVTASGSGSNCTLYRNNGDGTFTNMTNAVGLSGLIMLSAIWGDHNNDGFMDLYTSGSTTNGNRLFRNSGDSTRHWLKLTLEGTTSNRSAVGAQVRVRAGHLTMMRQVNTGTGYRSQNMLPVHFGLDTAAVADSVIVRWPAGGVTVLTGVSANQHLTVVEQPVVLAPNIVVNRDTIRLFEQRSDTMTVWNTGNALLTVDSITIGPGAALVWASPVTFSLAPGDSQRVIIQLIITSVNGPTDTASMFIHSNDPDDPVLLVRIEGSYLNSVNNNGASPYSFSLAQNYPNPFNPQTSIVFEVPEVSFVSLRIYDVLGRVVKEFDSEDRSPGRYVTVWDGQDVQGRAVASGVYFYKLSAQGVSGARFVQTRKLLLMR